MTEKRFYQISAGLPLLLPVVFFPVGVLAQRMALPFAEGLGTVAGILLMSVFFGGLPYLVLGGVVLWLLWKKPAKSYRLFSLVAPVAYSAFLFITVLLFYWGWENEREISTALEGAAYIASWGLGIGYVYVLIVHLVLRIFRCRGAFEAKAS